MVTKVHRSTADVIGLETVCGYVKSQYLPGSLQSLTPVLIRLMPVCSLTNFNNTIHMHALHRHAADGDLKE